MTEKSVELQRMQITYQKIILLNFLCKKKKTKNKKPELKKLLKRADEWAMSIKKRFINN